MTTPSKQPETAGSARKRPKRPLSNLILRGISAIGALGLIYGCLWRDVVQASGWAWAAVLAGCGVLGLREFYRLAAGAGANPFPWVGYLAGPAWILATEWDLAGGPSRAFGMAAAMTPALIALAAMLLQLTRKTNDNALSNIASTLLGVVYCVMLPGFLLHLRHLRLGPGGWPLHGAEFVVVCIFVAKVSDVGALLAGRQWGRRKLIPRLSPGKTWEGALGGLVFSVLLLQFMVWVEPRMALAGLGRPALLLLSLLLAAGGLAGDLAESALKRASRQKDAGTGVPGFGGVLDLVDSLVVAAPVMYFFLLVCGAEYVRFSP